MVEPRKRRPASEEEHTLVTWSKFAEEEPNLAQKSSDQLFQFGVGLAFIATVRKDGAPRLHPVCPVLSKSRLYILVMPGSPKRWDLERDGRYALQAFPQAKQSSDEVYLSGTARLVKDPALFNAVLADAKHHASLEEVLFELWVERAMHTRWEGFGTPDLHPIHTAWIAP